MRYNPVEHLSLDLDNLQILSISFEMSSENRSYLTSIAIGFAISITCIAIILRLLARKVQKLALGADDYVIIVGAVGFSIVVVKATTLLTVLSCSL